MDYTTTALLSAIRRKGSIPDTSAAGSADADVLSEATQVLWKAVCPLLLRVRENYLLEVKDYAITSGQSAYRIPPRALGGKLREVSIVDGSGNVRNLPEVDEEDLSDFGPSGTPSAFLVRGNSVVLLPAPDATTGTLRLRYARRPNQLVLPAAVGVISSISGGNITLAGTVPGTFTAAARYDIIRATPGFEWVAIDLTPTGAPSGTAIGFTASDLPSDFTTANYKGDYVCLAEDSPVAQVPPELHALLAQWTAAALLENDGDATASEDAMRKASKLEADAVALLTPRVDGEHVKLANGMFRGMRRSTFNGWGR
jgi:hypothetical protein